MSAWLLQATPLPVPILIGPTGGSLSASDLSQVVRLTAEGGGEPWMLVGLPPPFADPARWFVDVYLAPDRTTAGVRRGRIQVVWARLPAIAAYAAPKTWQAASSAEYAQVPVPGTNPDAVRDGRDLNRPFRLFGVISDEALLSIVSLVRSSPVIAAPATRTTGQPVARIATTVEGTWPIARVVVKPDTTVEVELLNHDPREKSGQEILLRGTGQVWIVERLGLWIAD